MEGFVSAAGALQAMSAAMAAPAASTAPGAAPMAGNFGQWMARELGALNTELLTAQKGVQQLAAGSATNLHEVMIQLEQARLALQLAVQVRARVLEAYQDVMRMQV